MLVDDPVKRVDNMTMAWGLEGRVPFLDHELVELAATCPPELKTAYDGKGVLKEAARKVIPHEVIDRPKGYFPVPALKHLAGPYLDLVATRCTAPRRVTAACSRKRRSTGCSPSPTGTSRRCAEIRCGRSACSSCGSPATSTEPRSHDVRHRARRTSPRGRSGPRLGPAGVRPDLRRPRAVRHRPARGGQWPARHRHVPRRAARLRRPASAGVLHRPELHLPVAVRRSPASTSRRTCRGCRCGRWTSIEDCGAINQIYLQCRMVPADVDLMWDNSQSEPHMVYLVATDDETGAVVGTVTGIDHAQLFDDEENGSSLWCLAVDPTLSRPGVGRPAGALAGRGVRQAGALADGPLGAARQRGRHRALRADGVRPRARAWHQAQERHQRETLRPRARRRGAGRAEPVRAHHRRRGDHAGYRRRGPRRQGRLSAASPTAAPAWSPGSRCPS